MTLSKGFILGGVGGLTAVTATIGTVVHVSTRSEVDELGIPKSCNAGEVKNGEDKTCELTPQDLKKIKFKDLEGGYGDVNVSGLTNTIKLTISHENDVTNYPKNKKYTFDNSTNESEIKITQDKDKSTVISKKTESYFKENDGGLTLVDTKLGIERKARMKEVNEILHQLGITGFDLEMGGFIEGTTKFKKKSRDIDGEELKKIKFEELEKDTSPSTNDLETGKKINLSIDYDNDEEKYPKNIKLTFLNNLEKNVTLKSGNKSIILKNKNNPGVFKTVKGKLVRALIIVPTQKKQTGG